MNKFIYKASHYSFKTMNSMTKNTVPFQAIDSDSALKLSETRKIIDSFFYDFCGLQPSRQGDSVVLLRMSRPKFTYEFAKDLCTNIYIEANRITARTVYREDKIKAYILKQCETLADWINVVGFHKLVSERAWQKILDMAELDPSSIVEDEKTGKKTGLSYWENQHQITWTYNDPVNDDMLRIVKERNALDRESFGQDSIIRNVFWSIRIFLEGSINRSRETTTGALTLDHEKMIHKESMVLTPAGASGQNESFLDRVKSGFGNILGVKKQ